MTEGETRCPRCGARTKAGDEFCRGCGSSLSVPRLHDPAATSDARPNSSRSVLREGGVLSTVVGVAVVLLLSAGIVVLVGGRLLGGDQNAVSPDGTDSGSGAMSSASQGPRDIAVPGGVDPAFGGMIEEWRSEGTGIPLLLPTYTPFAVDGVSADPFGSGTNNYYVWSDTDNQAADHLRVEILSASELPAEYMAQDTIVIGGEEYPYTEDTSWVTGTEPQDGLYTVALWVSSEEGEEYIYYVELNHDASPLPYEEFVETVSAMERLDPSDG